MVLHLIKMIAIGLCGVITIIYSELSTHIILLIGMYCVLYSLTNLFKIKWKISLRSRLLN
jgi:hypothetical protein